MTNKKNKKKEANIISYKILLDATGKVITERSILELDKMKGKLNVSTMATLKTIIRTADVEFKKIHNKIETELDAKVYKD
tara:strand:- start:34 stop:273 length:240 start_codon:yes stop_codon:yes gene_type:complete